MEQVFDTLIVITPKDFLRLKDNYAKLVSSMHCGKLLFVGSNEVGRLVDELCLGDRVDFLNEDDVLPFSEVNEVLKNHVHEFLAGEELPRGWTGWYYQQFIKMSYANICNDRYYMVWDGDTIPCRDIEMFDKTTGKPFMDWKREYHEEYFDTLIKLIPGMQKAVDQSFIAEHMLFDVQIMKKLLNDIESNGLLNGKSYWERILRVIPPHLIPEASFSEFETYGTYVSYYYPDTYVMRRWYSFRMGAEFFDPKTISERDYEWLGKDFHAISFEKNQYIREDHKNIFDNPAYQKKLTARQMLEIAQKDYFAGYEEKWESEDDIVNNSDKRLSEDEDNLIVSSPIDVLPSDSWAEYERLGDELVGKNNEQSYLCYENAAFLCNDDEQKKRINLKAEQHKIIYDISVNKTVIVILSYHRKYMIKRCLESILSYCPMESVSIVILDNNSDIDTKEWLKRIPENMATLLLSDENLGVARGYNEAMSFISGEDDIMFLDQDTMLTPNALFWLKMGLYDEKMIGAVGPVTNLSDFLQKTDIKFDFSDEYVSYACKNNVNMANAYEKTLVLDGFALLVKNKAYKKVGQFDEQFYPGMFEDTDYCMRLIKESYKLSIVHNSFIFRDVACSLLDRPEIDRAGKGFIDLDRANLSMIKKENSEKLNKKWGFDVERYLFLNDEEANMIKQITQYGFGKNKRFFLDYHGSGCGELLLRLKYLYPDSVVYGQEKNREAASFAYTYTNVEFKTEYVDTTPPNSTLLKISLSNENRN